MVGLGVVVFVAVFAAGPQERRSWTASTRCVRADYVVAGENFLSLPADTASPACERRPPSTWPPASTSSRSRSTATRTSGRALRRRPDAFARVWTLRLDRGRRGRPRQARHRRRDRRRADRERARPRAREEVQDAHRRGDPTPSFKLLAIYRDPMMLNGDHGQLRCLQRAVLRAPQLFMVSGGDQRRARARTRRRSKPPSPTSPPPT